MPGTRLFDKWLINTRYPDSLWDFWKSRWRNVSAERRTSAVRWLARTDGFETSDVRRGQSFYRPPVSYHSLAD